MSRPARLLLLALLTTALLPAPALADRVDDLAAEVLQLREDIEQMHGDRAMVDMRINGYFALDFITDSSSQTTTFRQHYFNLFMSKEWEHWQVLGELEFEDGVELEANPNTGTAEGTGAVVLEAAWFQYKLSDAFKVRGGKLLVPDYWREHHFAPVTMSVAPPLIYKKVFPGNATGLMAQGSVYPGKVGATYHLWVSNSDHHSVTDTDDGKGAGGKLTLHLGGRFPAAGRLDISALGFHTQHDYPPGGAGTPQPVDITGVELQYNTRRLELLAAYSHQDGSQGPEGFYVQPAVSLHRKLRAYYRFDGLDEGLQNPDPDAGMRIRHTGGLNWRPQPNITLKLEGNNTRYDDINRTTVQQMLASVALFF